MPYLTLLYGKKVIGQYSVDSGYPISIGRKDNNNIVINNLAVSGIHARVEHNSNGVFVIDMESKNGTFVNGKPTLKSLLKEGDVIVIGKHKLLFSETEDENIDTSAVSTPTISASDQGLDETMVLDTNKHRDMISNVLAGAAGQTRKKAVTPILLIQAGGSGKIALKNKFTRIGKDPANDVVIAGFFVGKRAATVTKQEDGYYIGHVNGLARTTVNNKKIKQVTKLKHGDIIGIGRLKMRFLSKAKAQKQ